MPDDIVNLETDLIAEDASRDIAAAVKGRRSIARRYLLWLRRRHPDLTPADLIELIERHYATSITTAGAVIAAGAIAADVGIAMIPGVGAAAAGAKSAGQQAAKKASKEAAKAASKEAAKIAAKQAAKGAALDAAKVGARRAAALLPAGDEQLQFEITAIYALAIADIHGMELDQDQAHALVYGLSNGRVSPRQIATMAADVAATSDGGVVGVGQRIAAGHGDWSHWATTLAEALPAGGARSLVGTIQTGQLDTVREGLSDQQQSAIEYGVGAVVGGVTRFVFGRDVIDAARAAFAAPPDTFPAHLAVPKKVRRDDDAGAESNRAVAALQDAAKATGSWLSGSAAAVGSGVASGSKAVGAGVAAGADTATRPFRRVDIDGDGIPDAPRALTAVRGAGAAVAGAVGRRVSALRKPETRPAIESEPAPGTPDSDTEDARD